MPPLCALILAYICVPQEYVPVSQLSSMIVETDAAGKPVLRFNPAIARRRGIEIDAWDSDDIHEVSPALMNKACSGGWCIYYRKHCDAELRNCQYVESDPVPADFTRTFDKAVASSKGFEIHARSRAIYRETENTLRLVLHTGDDGRSAYLPLTKLTQLSDSINVTNCMRSVWMQGCGPPPFPRLPRPTRL
jgi:hypothetical protein